MSRSVVFGIHAVSEYLKRKTDRALALYLKAKCDSDKLMELQQLAKSKGIAVQRVNVKQLDKLSKSGNHQGVLLEIAEQKAGGMTLEAFLKPLEQELPKSMTILALDEVQDPHNLGAILRTALAMHVSAVILPKNRTAPITPTVRKVASGAADILPIITVTNLARALESCQEAGFWVYGADGAAQESLYKTDFSHPSLIVMGGEGKGLRQQTQKVCDSLIQIPIHPEMESLNVSVATAVILGERLRQRGG